MKIRKRYVCLMVALLIGGGIWHASLHRPIGPAEGVKIQGADYIARPSTGNTIENNSQSIVPLEVKNNRQPSRLRLGTFNIHGCKGSDGRRDVNRVANCLKGLDFVALNEVSGPDFFEKQDQAELLGRRLDMAWLFAPSVRQWYCLESGNALLTKKPVVYWHRIPLIRRVDYSYRNAVQVDLQMAGNSGSGVVHVLLTHVNRRYDSEREAQLKEVISMFLALPEPAVLLGDLNSNAKDSQIRHLMSLPGVIDAVGHVLGPKDSERIDWIFLRGLRSVDAGIVDNGSSDHPLIWAEVE